MLTTVRRSRPKGPLRAVPGATNNRKIGGRLCYCDTWPAPRRQRPQEQRRQQAQQYPSAIYTGQSG